MGKHKKRQYKSYNNAAVRELYGLMPVEEIADIWDDGETSSTPVDYPEQARRDLRRRLALEGKLLPPEPPKEGK